MSNSLRSHGLQHTRLSCPSLSPSLLKLMSIESVMPSSHLILCRPLFLLPSNFPSIRIFSSESALCIRCQNIGASVSAICPLNEYSGLIYFRINWFDLVVQETLKSLLQHHSLKASVLGLSPFFMVQISHLYVTTGKTIALTRRTFVGKEMTLLFNMLSMFVIVFLQGADVLISWLQSPSAVILEPRQIKSLTVFFFSPSTCHKVMEPDAMILIFFNVEF